MINGVRVIEMDPRDPRWGTFVQSHADALIYHHPLWLQVLSRENGTEGLCLACENSSNEICGVLPLLTTRGVPLVKGQLIGRRLASLPRTPLAGPLAVADVATAALLREAAARVAQDQGSRLQVKVASPRLDGFVEGMAAHAWRRYYFITLPQNPDDLRFGNSRNHARIRSTVNRAAATNLSVRESDSEADLRAWYLLYLETMRRHAVLPRSYRFFNTAWELLRPRRLFRLLVAESHAAGQTTLLAGSIFLTFGSTFFYAFNGSSHQHSSPVSPNDVIQWRAIHDACKEGFRYYDMGEVPEGHYGLAEFKSKWGTEEKWLHRYYYPSPQKVESGALSTNRTAKVMTAVWRRIPLKATMLAGDWLYRYL